MKKAHLFLPHKFSGYAIDFFRTNFKAENFDYIIVSIHPVPEELQNIEGAEYHSFNSKRDEVIYLRNIMNYYDRIYIHSSFLSPDVKIALFVTAKEGIKKLVWVDWGYDLYNSSSNGIIEFLKNIIKRIDQLLFDKSIPNFIGIHPVDLIEYKKRIRGKANLYFAPYRFSTEHNQFLLNYKKQSLRKEIEGGKPLVIQIAHRAEPEMHHIRILKKLEKYKDRNIRILMPMNYGDMVYAEKVEKYARSIFGDKIEVLHEMLAFDKYMEYLSAVDILVIDSYRQIALGSIYPMLYMQKKIFMPKDSILAKYFSDNNVKIYNIDDIGKMSWKELTEDDDLLSGRKFIINFNSESPVSLWQNAFHCIN